MSLRILRIGVYGYNGERSSIRLNASGMSIITGESKTGKSSLIDIIEYCFGREQCHVSDGVIRQHVAWYGILIDRGDTRIFIARRNPKPPRTRDPDVYVAIGGDVEMPERAVWSPNWAVEAIEKLLTTSVGIAENVTTVPDGQTRQTLSANIKHALLFCIQDQDEIDSRKILFHRQGEQFMPQTIKDVLPYFLGAIDEDRLRRKSELDAEKKELRRLEKVSGEREQLAGLSAARTEDMFREAQSVGLLPAGPPPGQDDALGALRGINPVIREAPIPPDSTEPIVILRRERASLRHELSSVRERLRQIRHIEDVAGGFALEAKEQRARLATLGLAKNGDAASCALCGSPDISVPAATEMHRTLVDLEEQLSQVRREVPRLQEAQGELVGRQNELEQSLKRNQDQIDALAKQDEAFRSEQESQLRLARTLGRIAYFLETLPPQPLIGTSATDLEAARRRVAALEKLLDPESTADRLASILNLIGEYMTRYSQRLDLEHSGSRLRLDIRQLAVVADTLDGPVPLYRMGSGENWVGYHVLAYLALHRWFRQKKRPVPGFVFFDQPSQAHYPAEKDRNGDVEGLPDADREAVYKLFKLMSDVAQELSPDFQLIVTDHADLREGWFADAVVARWRGSGLVPRAWIA
ncbi:DUF3732 domain-containing protein [Beijerinckia indica]|uniref:DUF3732 domain-containing protein n=1 Tax=Beijerinckia indica subsp. indica (strain ATCC 9039 / DSM 1715 / NCIMB 8712) TaxID=395963 RepID=B2IKU2_BEII9|nr:DUF3732 domain-containing protein [Beijerinckia indica]ACB95134.1 conserved hypothetical protein [Beijerinckia indica subsp. indica ATCC 9039]